MQVHVLSRSGIHITGVDVMHLNKECHFPDLSNLFERTDVSAAVQPLLGKIGWEIDAQLAMLDGPLPMQNTNMERERHGLKPLDVCSEKYKFDQGWTAEDPVCLERIKRYQTGDQNALDMG